MLDSGNVRPYRTERQSASPSPTAARECTVMVVSERLTTMRGRLGITVRG